MHEETKGSKVVKWILIGISVLFLFIMLVLPLATVLTEALKSGWQVFWDAVSSEYTLKAVLLTLEATARSCFQYNIRIVRCVVCNKVSL